MMPFLGGLRRLWPRTEPGLATLGVDEWERIVRNHALYPHGRDEISFHECEVKAPTEAVFAFCLRPGNLCAMTPPRYGMCVESGDPATEIARGAHIRYSSELWGVRTPWHAYYPYVFRDEGAARESGFVDIQVGGLFTRWCHIHRFTPTSKGTTRLSEIVRWTLPGHALASSLARGAVESRLRALIAFRHEFLRDIPRG